MQKKNFLVIKHKRYLYKKLCKNSLKPKTSSRKRIYSKYMRIKKYLKKIITKKRTRKLRKILYIFAYRKRMRLFLRYRIAKLPLRDKFTRFIRKRLRKLFIIAKRNKNTIKNILYTMRYDRHDDIYKPEKASKRARYYHFKAEFVIFQKLKITKKNAEDIQIKMTQKFIKYQRILLARKIKRKLHEIIENWIKKCYAKKEFLESKFIKEINKKLPKPITAKKLAFVLTQYVSENLTTGYKKNKPYKNNNKYNKNKKKILKRKKQIIPQRYNQKKPKIFKRRVRKQATRLAKQVGLRMFSFKRFLRQKGMRNIYYIRMLKKYVLTEKKIQIEKNLGTFLIELNKINDKLSIQGWLQLYTQLNSRNIRFKEFPTEINPRIFHYYRKRAITVFKTFLSAIKVAQFYVTKKDEKKMIKRLKFRLFHEILCKKKGGQLSITKTKKKFYKQNISSTQLTFNKKPKQLVKELIDDIQHRFIKKKICKEYTNFLQKKKTTNVCNSFFYRNIYLENFFNNNKLVEKKDFSLNKITNYKKIKETEAYSKTIKYYLSTQNKIRKKKKYIKYKYIEKYRKKHCIIPKRTLIFSFNKYNSILQDLCKQKKKQIIIYLNKFFIKKSEITKELNNATINTYGVFEKNLDDLIKNAYKKIKRYKKKLNFFHKIKNKMHQIQIVIKPFSKFQKLFEKNKNKTLKKKNIIKKNYLKNNILKLPKIKKKTSKLSFHYKQKKRNNLPQQTRQKHSTNINQNINQLKKEMKKLILKHPLKDFFVERRAFLQERIQKKYSLHAATFPGVKHSLLFTIFRICVLSHDLKFIIRNRGSAKRRRKIRKKFFKKKYEFISTLKKFLKKKLKVRVPYRFTWVFLSKFMLKKLRKVKRNRKPKKIYKKRKSIKIFLKQKKFLPVKRIQITTPQVSLKTLKNRKNVISEFLQSVLNNLHFEKIKINKLINTTLDRNTLAYNTLENNLRFFLFKLQTNTQFLQIDYSIKKGFSFFNFNFFYPETNPFAILHVNTFITFNTYILRYAKRFNKFIKRLKNLNKNRGIRIFNHFALYKNYIFYIFKKAYKKKKHGNFYKFRLKKGKKRKKRRLFMRKRLRLHNRLLLQRKLYKYQISREHKDFLNDPTTNDKYANLLHRKLEITQQKRLERIKKKPAKRSRITRKDRLTTLKLVHKKLDKERLYVNEKKRQVTKRKKRRAKIAKHKQLVRRTLRRIALRRLKQKVEPKPKKKKIKRLLRKLSRKHIRKKKIRNRLKKQKNHIAYTKVKQYLYRKTKHGTRVLTNILYNYMF